MDFFDALLTIEGLTYFVILALLEIVLGIDNIIFISIVTDKLPKEEQRRGRNLGLSLALIIRLILLVFVAWIMKSVTPLFPNTSIELLKNFSMQSLVLFLGGLFLIYKSTVEMHSSIKGQHDEISGKGKNKLSAVILQIVLIDIVFSFDSIITAIGMTNDLQKQTGHDPLVIIYAAVIVSMIVMMLFAKPISDFINNRPTIKMIALAFLVTIGVILVAEAFGQHVPKGYIYFAMCYALIVEFLNIRMRKNKGVSE
ncbi:TerC family protein [Crocinitomicaceae bacterium CZZ-1]|uniref:TerC family protein n=1 Tax=Taishania pollutisoli TaxID=2766479 RepID=A0A8J6TTI0_9FLAO|nr:TerC family protein [Taishania pollutisoli]MBC9812864.1 TerC family protein [Taishania pollutisoli]MBX2949686.1 TerC family protein [Crocinitomicaceae bacterium]NGF76105.1 TerC family protein [Fluviicola sp. SGL-29]